MARAKKSVSDNVVLAQSRNRSAEHSLKRAMRRLNDQEQLVHDRHQREVLQWRDFRRQSIKTSGTWGTSFEEEFGEDWSAASQENLDTPRDKRDSENSSGASSRNSPRLNSRRGSSAGACNDMARCSSLVQSDALIKLQQPWAYTYSMTSYNSLYKESMQLAEGHKKRLNFRRASESRRSTSPVYMKMFRSRSSVGDDRQDFISGSQRPLTGRSTPGIPLRTKSSRHRLSPSASIEKTRPRTSVGLVRGAKNEYKELYGQKTKDSATQHGPDDHPKAENCNSRLENASQQNGGDDALDGGGGGDALDSLPTMIGKTSDSASSQSSSALPVSDPKPPSPCETAESLTTTDPHSTKLHLSVLEDRLETHLNGGPPLISETGDDSCPQEQEQMGSVNKEETPCPAPADTARTDQLASFSDTPERQVREKKVHIKVTAKDRKADTQPEEMDSKSTQDPNCAKHAMSSADNSKRDENVPPLTKTEAETSWPSPSTPRRPQIRTDCRDHNPLKSTGQDCSMRRGSDLGVLRQRSDMTSCLPRSGRRNSGALSRRYSVIDVSGPSSFMKIADQLEALREFSQQRMIPIDDDKEDWAEEGSCGSPNQVNTSITPLSWKQLPGQESRTLQRSQTKSLRETGTASRNEFETLNSPQSEHLPASHVSNSPTKDQPSQSKKASLDKTSNEVSQRNSDYNTDEVADFAQTPHNSTPVSLQKNKAADITVFKGFQLHNYVRPQERYRTDALVHLRRERSMPPLSTKNSPMRVSSQTEVKPAVTFSRTSRQKVLQELVHRHNRPIKTADSGVVSPQLRSRIDQFLKTIEPYCPN